MQPEESEMSKHKVDMMVHVKGQVANGQWQALGVDLARHEGLGAVYQNPKLQQVLMVEYDPRATTAAAILATVRGRGIEARVVGL